MAMANLQSVGNREWRVSTSCGVVTVWAASEAQAMARAKWKAVHIDQVFRNLAEERIAVRDCEVYEVKRVF